MKKILSILGTITLTTTAAANIVACSSSVKTFNESYDPPVKYSSSYFSKSEVGPMFMIDWKHNPYTLVISFKLYEKFEDKLEPYIKTTDSLFNLGLGTISKIKFSYKINDKSKDIWELLDLYDIQGTRNNW